MINRLNSNITDQAAPPSESSGHEPGPTRPTSVSEHPLEARRSSSDAGRPRTLTDLPRELVQEVAGFVALPKDKMAFAAAAKEIRGHLPRSTIHQARLAVAISQASRLTEFESLLAASGQKTETGQPESIRQMDPAPRRELLADLAGRLAHLPWTDVAKARDLVASAIADLPQEHRQQPMDALREATAEATSRMQFAHGVVHEGARQNAQAQRTASADIARIGANLRNLG